MAVKKYKLVIMGASGVGKSVFLGSYFYAAIHRGMGKKHAVSLQKDAIKPVQDLIDKLFKGAQEGTDRRINMSFDVDDTMDVQLYDLPGGYTTDVDQWLAQGIEEDLRSADGVIFFISADDLLNNTQKCMREALPFTTAIQTYLRKKKKGDVYDRADVPIYFVFTKCDLIKNETDSEGRPYTAKKLLAEAGSLEDAAKVGKNSLFFGKGKHDRAYMTCALGDWLDANTPPSESKYEPTNVIEPMEDLFDAMQGSRTSHARVKKILGIAAAIVFFVGLIGVDWSVQYTRWGKTEKAAKMAETEKDFPVAISIYEDYRRTSPFLPIIPRFILPGRNVNDRINSLNVEYEKYSYNKLESYLKNLDMSKLPDTNSTSFQVAADEIDAYLKNEYFVQIDPKHYEEVQQAEPYYTVGKILAQEIRTYDDLQYVLNKIDSVPENWQPALHECVRGGVHTWGQAVTQEAEKADPTEALGMVSRAIAQARSVLGHPMATDAMSKQIEEQIDRWNNLTDQLFDKRVDMILAQEIKTYDDIQDALNEIDNIPENRQPALLERARGGVHIWGQAVVEEAELEADPTEALGMVNQAIAQARSVLGHPRANDAMREQIEMQIDRWSNLTDQLWGKRVNLILAQEIRTYDDLQATLSEIDSVPENWQPTLLEGVRNGVHTWGQAVAQEAEKEDDPTEALGIVSRAIAQARSVLGHSRATDAMREQIEMQIDRWNDLTDQLWDKRVGLLITKAADAVALDAEGAVKLLESAKAELTGMPKASLEKLDAAIARHYVALVDDLVQSWKSNEDMSTADMRAELDRIPDIVHEAKEVAFEYIRQQEGIILENYRSNLSSASNLANLSKVWQEAMVELSGTSYSHDELNDTLQKKFSALVESRLVQANNQIESNFSGGYFKESLQEIDKVAQEINNAISVFASSCDTEESLSRLNDWQKENRIKAEEAEYKYIKDRFKEIVNSKNISDSLRQMNEYVNRYPNSEQNAKVKKAIDYLTDIRDGCSGRLTIEGISINRDNRGWYNPRKYVMGATLEVKVSGSANGTTNDRHGKAKEKVEMNDSFDITWEVNSPPLVFDIYDIRQSKDTPLARISVDVKGVDGWKKINGAHSGTNGSVMLRVYFNGLRECPSL